MVASAMRTPLRAISPPMNLVIHSVPRSLLLLSVPLLHISRGTSLRHTRLYKLARAASRLVGLSSGQRRAVSERCRGRKLGRDGTSRAKQNATQDESEYPGNAQGRAHTGGWNPPTGIPLASSARRGMRWQGSRLALVLSPYDAITPLANSPRLFSAVRVILETPAVWAEPLASSWRVAEEVGRCHLRISAKSICSVDWPRAT